MKAAKVNLARSVSVWFLLSLLAVGSARALDPTRHISQYGHSSWKIQDGYFGGQPVSITQTKDGYLWVETEGGIFRFDGVQFVSWSSLTGEKLPSPDYWPMLGAREAACTSEQIQVCCDGQISASWHDSDSRRRRPRSSAQGPCGFDQRRA